MVKTLELHQCERETCRYVFGPSSHREARWLSWELAKRLINSRYMLTLKPMLYQKLQVTLGYGLEWHRILDAMSHTRGLRP